MLNTPCSGVTGGGDIEGAGSENWSRDETRYRSGDNAREGAVLEYGQGVCGNGALDKGRIGEAGPKSQSCYNILKI